MAAMAMAQSKNLSRFKPERLVLLTIAVITALGVAATSIALLRSRGDNSLEAARCSRPMTPTTDPAASCPWRSPAKGARGPSHSTPPLISPCHPSGKLPTSTCSTGWCESLAAGTRDPGLIETFLQKMSDD